MDARDQELLEAVKNQNAYGIRQALVRGANPNAFLPSKRDLIDNRTARFDFYPWSPLEEAIKTGNLESVRILVANGADVNALSYSIDTFHRKIPADPLSLTISLGHTDIMHFLIEQGANPKGNHYPFRQRRGCHPPAPPIIWAGNSLETLQFLIAQGADPSQEDTRQHIARQAISNDQPDVLSYLTQHYGHNIHDWHVGMSLVEEAAYANAPKTVAYLLKEKVPYIRRKGPDFGTPLDLASKRHYNEVGELLILDGAQHNKPLNDHLAEFSSTLFTQDQCLARFVIATHDTTRAYDAQRIPQKRPFVDTPLTSPNENPQLFSALPFSLATKPQHVPRVLMGEIYEMLAPGGISPNRWRSYRELSAEPNAFGR